MQDSLSSGTCILSFLLKGTFHEICAGLVKFRYIHVFKVSKEIFRTRLSSRTFFFNCQTYFFEFSGKWYLFTKEYRYMPKIRIFQGEDFPSNDPREIVQQLVWGNMMTVRREEMDVVII